MSLSLSPRQAREAERLLRFLEDSPLQDYEVPRDWFHEGQLSAFASDARSIAVISGTQGGKTCFLPWWLLREIQRCGPGEYAVVSPTFPLMYKKCQPEFVRVFEKEEKVARFVQSPVPRLVFTKSGMHKVFGKLEGETTVFFCYAEDSDALESMTLKGAALDEAGQRAFKQTSFEALGRRLAIHKGRMCIGTTPYEFNWLKHIVYDGWMGGNKDFEVVSFSSIMNPTFDKEEYERQRGLMPPHRFSMMYDGKFTKPAGAIYDCLDEDHWVEPFEIPQNWPRIMGVDFGQVNTAAVFFAINPLFPEAYVYSTYHRGGMDGMAHAENIASIHGRPSMAMGGAPSEQAWRDEFARGGIAVLKPPFADVELGIDTVYGLIKSRQLKFFKGLEKLKIELEGYSREVNEAGEVVSNKIEDKNKYHRCDALRYGSILLAPYLKAYGEQEVVVRGDPIERNRRIFERGIYAGKGSVERKQARERPSGVVFSD